MLGTDSVPVHPPSQAGVAREPEQFQDLHAVDVSVAVLSQRTREPTDPCRASDGVQAEGPDGLAVVAVDGEAHCGPVDVASVRGLGSVAVADVPDAPLSTLRGRGQDLIPRGDLSAHCSPTALLLDHEFSVVCQDQGQIGLSGFVHVASMGQNGQESKGPGPVPQLSQTLLF